MATVTSNTGVEYFLWPLPELSAKEVSMSIEFSELRNELGNGFRSSVLYGSNTGLRSWNVTLPTLADTSVLPNTVIGINGETTSREAAIWDLYCETRVTGQPFVYQCPRSGQYYLVDFKDNKLTYAKQAYIKLYSTGLELTQVRLDGETVFDPDNLTGLITSFSDGVLDPLMWTATGDVVTASAVQNGRDVLRFNATTNNGFVEGDTGTFYLQEAFIVMKMRESAFSTSAGILSGTHSIGGNVALVGDIGTTKFFNCSFGSAYEYRLNNEVYAEANQQAPMNVFGVVHIRHTAPGILIDILQAGWDRDIVGRFAEVDIAELLVFDLLQPKSMVREIYEYLTVKWDIAIA